MSTTRACAKCQKTDDDAPNMKRCAKCQTTHYCSRECQKVHWKIHKKVCSTNAASHAEGDSKSGPNIEHASGYKTPRVKSLSKQIPDPFTRLDNNTYLHDRPEQDVYKLLIDAFRMRQADEFKFGGRRDPNSVYTGAPSSITGFREFISQATRVLPPWWDTEKAKECEQFGENDGHFSTLKKKLDKATMIEEYGDERMPMQVRMLAEEVYGCPPAGSGPGTAMRQLMMAMESGNGSDGMHMTMMGL
ncbi:putative MYND domain protein [Byssothecium circinans]|uniref:Putative MYND domain protein n=1 Tax=Byssothecium circinans TaxID=147558 RepID=A0A6A5TNX5_9PLEO|nr:putative MYND domain protein [Byssothecium circinans]